MTNHYVIKVYLSRILRNCKESTFTMFIDGSKITIIYELMEWIRWLFSLKECFYLAHENSVIHDFEDIRILSTVKELIIKPCESICFHKGSHKILFSKINVYTQWECLKVPKIFFDKINKKINISDDLTTNKLADKKSNKNKIPKINCASKKGSLSPNEINETDKIQISDSNMEKNLFSNKDSTNGDVSGTNSSSSSENDNVKSKKSKIISNDNVKSKKNKKISNDVEVSEINLVKNQPNIDQKITPVNHQSNNFAESNPLETNIKIEPKSTSPSKHAELFKFSPKPFSIGDLLSNLREKNRSNLLAESPKNDTKTNPLIQCTSLPNQNTFDNDLEEPKKKKKRKRSRSKKKLNGGLVNFVAAEANPVIPEVKPYFEEKKPNHIRFDIDCESEDMDMEVHTNHENKDVSKFTCGSNIQKRCCSNLISTNLDEIKEMLNEKKQALSSLNSTSISPYERNCSTQTSNGIFTKEDNIIIFEEQSAVKFKGSEPNCVNQDLKSLIQLKEKFPCPVVIERFY